MIRRRIAVAIYGLNDVEVPRLRESMQLAGADSIDAISEISPNVLGGEVLEQAVPAITLMLPTETASDDATRAAKSALARSDVAVETDAYILANVLVHDLRFTIPARTPTAVRDVIAQEGILSDALGNYTVRVGDGELSIFYTGTLLSDEVVESVREGMARAAGTQAGKVAVLPRSLAGTGVDLATEPLQSEGTALANDHHGLLIPSANASDFVPAPGPGLGTFSLFLFLSTTVLVIVLSLVFRRRRSTPRGAGAKEG